MVAVFLLSALWTLALALVQIAPSEVANALMGTAHLDFGDFWTLQRAENALALAATVLLLAIALGYFALVVEMVRVSKGASRPVLRSRRSAEIHPHDVAARPSMSLIRGAHNPASLPRTTGRRQPSSVRVNSRRDPDQRHQLWWWLRSRVLYALMAQDAPALALPKLLLQTSILFRYLQDGFPPSTIFLYASLLLLNWLISTYCAMKQLVDPRVALVRIFYSFDLFFAVLAPLHVVVHAYNEFNFDSAEFATHTDVLNPGSFEVVARLFADPQEVSLFRAAFRSLQLSSLWSLLVKTALNAFTIRKWRRTIRLLSQPDLALPRLTPTQRLSRLNAMLFFAMGIAIFVYSIVSVVSSTVACAQFEQCKVPSYRWNVGALECSCSVFVDRQTVVRTFDEWLDPVDTTANLARLAASGDLKVVQIINRQLPTLPEELRGCIGLEQLILVYTKIITIPDWAKDFVNLEYLHIEGDHTAKQLQSLPRDLFANMRMLTFLHLGCLQRVPFVPDLDHVPHLKYLTLALLHSVTVLPSFDKLVHLERLTIVDAIQVTTLPRFSSLHKLGSFSLAGRNPVCCNGFLSGVCDLSSTCQGDTPAQQVDCSDKRISSSDRALIDAVGFPVCQDSQLDDFSESPVARESSDGACGGVLYKLCEYQGVLGMCTPPRWMVVNCESYPPYEAVRRLQIQRGVGDPCDPEVEAWLGCGAH